MNGLSHKLKAIERRFFERGLHPRYGFELEFFGKPVDLELAEYKIVKEEGEEQYELISPIFSDVILLCEAIDKFRNSHPELDFRPKPYSDQAGSGLHIHFNLVDGVGNNFFAKQSFESESHFLNSSVGGIFAKFREYFSNYIQTEADVARFVPSLYQPTTLSFGNNNRSCMIRIPDDIPNNRRIELRIASASADPYLLLYAILESVLFGINNNIIPPQKTYGVAHHPSYRLELILDEGWCHE